MRALNIFGTVALALLGLYVGWALTDSTGEPSSSLAVRVASTPAGRWLRPQVGPGYPNQRPPRDGWFWPLLLGWIALACIVAIAGWLVVGAIAGFSDQAHFVRL